SASSRSSCTTARSPKSSAPRKPVSPTAAPSPLGAAPSPPSAKRPTSVVLWHVPFSAPWAVPTATRGGICSEKLAPHPTDPTTGSSHATRQHLPSPHVEPECNPRGL